MADKPDRWTMDSLWRCPCGQEIRFVEFRSHRRKPLPPECVGDAVFLSQGTGKWFGPSLKQGQNRQTLEALAPSTLLEKASGGDASDATQEQSPPPAADHSKRAPLPPIYEYFPDSSEFGEAHDPEEIARRLLSGGGGAGGGADLFDLSGGGWEIDYPDDGSPQTQEQLSVKLPSVVKVWYDYMRARGWHQGDGSISAFVADALIDHFANCWNLAVLIVNKRALEAPEEALEGEPVDG